MTTEQSCRNLVLGITCALAALLSLGGGFAQSVSSGSSAATAATLVPRRLQGQITNALDGVAIPRVLVQINNRSVLTDSQGRFEFPEFTDTQAFVTLTKPGFSQSSSNSLAPGRQRIQNLDTRIDLKLYPNATITGTVTGRDGLPLTHIPVTIKRGMLDQTGWRWVATRTLQTDLHGEYRLRTPGGRYQIQVGYVARSHDTGETVLPLIFPTITSGNTLDYFEVQNGQERHVDLRPKTGVAYPVPVHLDAPDQVRGVQFFATTSGGEAFSVASQGGTEVNLPAGTYKLYARLENRDTTMEGSTRVTVTGRQTDSATIQLEPATAIPVELSIDASSIASSNATNSSTIGTQIQSLQSPDLRQFNLRLHNLDQSGLPFSQDVALRPKADHGYEFLVSPGRYRLQAAGGGSWWIASATSGVTNLMESDIVVSSGGSGTPIRIVASNAQGMVSATIHLKPDTDSAYLYFISSTPSFYPVNPLTIINSGTATATVSTRLPVGNYVAVALDHRIEADIHDPDVLARLSSATKAVDISTSATANIELELAQEKKP